MDEGSASHWLVSALIGASTAVLAGIPVEHYRRHRDRQSTAAVIGADIAGLLHVVERGAVVANFEKILSSLDAGKDVPIPRAYTEKPEFGPIFEKHIDKLGLLPVDVSDRVVRFYGYMRGLRASMKNLFDGVFDSSPNPAVAKAAVIRSGLALWRDAAAVGAPLVIDLNRIATEPWWPGKSLLISLSRKLPSRRRPQAKG